MVTRVVIKKNNCGLRLYRHVKVDVSILLSFFPADTHKLCRLRTRIYPVGPDKAPVFCVLKRQKL